MTRMSMLAAVLLLGSGCQAVSLPNGTLISLQEKKEATPPAGAESPIPSESKLEEEARRARSTRRSEAQSDEQEPKPDEPQSARPQEKETKGQEEIPAPRLPQIGRQRKFKTPEERKRDLLRKLEPDSVEKEVTTLELPLVLDTVLETFPLIQAMQREAIIASGKQQTAQGPFDLKLQAESMNMPQSFYKNYRQMVKAEQATWMGGAVYGQYRVGNGFFQPWFGERETNEGGEFKIGIATPLLQNRQFDARRAEILKADLQRSAVDPAVQSEMIEAVFSAAYVYWAWVGAGHTYMVTQSLLEVAQQRNTGIARQVELGNLPRTELQQNERIIASREGKLIEARKKLQSAAIKLSLFLRNSAGQPQIPPASLLPDQFPQATAPNIEKLEADIRQAISTRPELRDLTIQRQITTVDLDQASNEQLPRLDAVIEAGKDVGAPSSPKGDKTPFELEAGLMFEVPYQRNKARGKAQTAQGKLSQLAIKQGFTEDKISTEVRDAMVAVQTAYERIERAREGARLARELVVAEYRSFDLGNSDVLRIAIQEALELDSRLLEIESLTDYFQALAAYRAAMGQYMSPR